MPFPPRDSQTRIKHLILQAYAGAWAGIITAGMRRIVAKGKAVNLELVYLDAFAGRGTYDRDTDDETGEAVYGSPVIATRALAAAAESGRMLGLNIRLSVIAIEKEFSDELEQAALQARLPLEVRRAALLDARARGAFTIMRGDCRDHIGDIVSKFHSEDFVLAFIDPFGESMSLEDVGIVLRRPRTDGITLFPVAEVDKHGGSARKKLGIDTVTPVEFVNLARTDAHFGTEEWRRIASSDASFEERAERYARLYDRQLRTVDQRLIVKKIALRFSKLGRAGYHLFLTTRDADGALRMNDILRNAEIREHWELWKDREARVRIAHAGQESLFQPAYVPPVQKVDFSGEDAAALVGERLPPAGTTVTLKELHALMAEEVLTAAEIMKGLRLLRKGVQPRVSFDPSSQGAKTEITVLR